MWLNTICLVHFHCISGQHNHASVLTVTQGCNSGDTKLGNLNLTSMLPSVSGVSGIPVAYNEFPQYFITHLVLLKILKLVMHYQILIGR